MRRRDLLTSAMAVAAGGCASQKLAGDAAVSGPGRSLEGMDRGLARISDPFRGFVQRETGIRDLTIPERERQLLEGSLRSMLVLGSLRDLPPELRRHPEVEARVSAMVPEGGRSLHGLAMHMEQLSAAERTLMQQRLVRDPELPARTAEHLDRMAKIGGLGATSRLHLRRLASDTAWRLGHQPVSLFLDETTARMSKAAIRAGESMANQRSLLAARMQDDEEWDEGAEYEEYEEEGEPPRRRERRPWGGRAMAIAGGAAGIIGLVGGYGALMWAAAQSYSSSSQTGPIALGLVSGGLFVSGVIVMILGLVLKSKQDEEWQQRNVQHLRRRRR